MTGALDSQDAGVPGNRPSVLDGVVRQHLPRAIRAMWWVFAFLNFFSILWTTYEKHFHSKTPFAYRGFVLPLVVKTADLMCFQDRFKLFGTSAFFTAPGTAFNYSPAMAAVLHGFFAIPVDPVGLYDAVAFVWLLVISYFFIREMSKRGISAKTSGLLLASMLWFGYPVYLMTYLNNLELLVWIPLFVGMWAYLTGRLWLAAMCFALSGSLKYFPAIFLALLLPRKAYKEFLGGCVLTVLLLIAAAWYVGPTLMMDLRGFQAQMVPFTKYYLLQWHAMEGGIDHSVYGLIKAATLKTKAFELLPLILKLYFPITAITLVSLFFFRIRKIPAINQILALTVASITLTPLSHDYTLVHLYAPLGAIIIWLVSRPAGYVPTRSVVAMLICFGILLAPITFIEKGLTPLSGQFRCLLLIVLLVLSVSKHSFFTAEGSSFEELS